MVRIIIMAGNAVLACSVVFFSFMVGYFVGERSVQKEAIERNLAAYCPNDASFSWMEVIKPLDVLMETTDCKE